MMWGEITGAIAPHPCVACLSRSSDFPLITEWLTNGQLNEQPTSDSIYALKQYIATTDGKTRSHEAQVPLFCFDKRNQ